MADTEQNPAVLRQQFLDATHEQFKASATASKDNRDEAKTDLEFLALKQWDEAIVREREGLTGHDKPSLTMDQIGDPYRQLVGRQKQADPAIQVSPAGDGADQEAAEIFQGLIRHYAVTGHAKEARDEAFKGAAGPGWGYYGLLIQDEAPGTFRQTIVYRPIENIFTVYDDPLAKGALKRDRRFLYITQDLPRDEFKRLYPQARFSSQADFVNAGERNDLPDWYPEGHVRVAERWYLDDEVTGTMALLSDGRELPLEQAQAAVASSTQMGQPPPGAVLNLNPQTPAAVEIVRQKQVTKRVVKWAKMSGAEILEGNAGTDIDNNTEGRTWPGSYIPFVRVVGERLVVDGEERLSGIVRPMRDPQRLYNYNASEYAHELAGGPKTRVIMAEGQQEGHEREWENPERRDRPFYLYKPVPLPDNPMVAAPPPTMVNFTDSAKLMALLQAMNQAKADLKSASGYYDSADPSRRNTEQSAKAIMARKQESDQSSLNYVDNYQSALLYEGELLIDLIPKIVVKGQILRVLDFEDQASHIMVGVPFQNGPTGQPQPIPPGQAFQQGLHKFFDPTVGTYDVAVTIGSNFATRRQEAFAAQTTLMQSLPPQMAAAVAPVAVRNSDWPGSVEIADRLDRMLPPGVVGTEDQNIPPALAARVKQMQQQAGQVIQHLTAIVEKLEQERDAKAQELAAKIEMNREDNATKLRIAETQAKQADAEARAELMAQQLEGAQDRTAQLLDQAHDVGTQAADQAHEQAMSAQDHQQALEAGAQQAAAAQAQAAQEQQQPEAGA